jgi:hypothetical protein
MIEITSGSGGIADVTEGASLTDNDVNDPLLTKTPEPTSRKRAASSECLRTGARLVPAITSSIQAAACPPQHSRGYAAPSLREGCVLPMRGAMPSSQS